MENNQNLTKKERRELKRKEKQESALKTQSGKKNKLIALWVVIFLFVAAGIGGIILLVSKSTFSGGVSQPALLTLSASDWILEKKENNDIVSESTEATLIEYSDFQCPACAFFSPILEKLSKDLDGKVKIAYRHFPLPQHKNAKIAAYAAEAAGAQRKFFEMSSKIFEDQKDWSDISENNAKNLFKELALELGLNIEQFEKDRENGEIKDSVEKDLNDGRVLGINSTPTFYLNGKKMQNLISYDAFKKAVEEEINRN